MLAAVIVVIMAIALAATTSAFRMFLYETYSELTGTILNIDTEKTVSETYDIVNFKYKDKVVVPGWLPDGMKLIDCTDNLEDVVFKYNDKNNNWISITERSFSLDFIESIQTKDNEYATYQIDILDTKGTFVEMVSETNKKTYATFWYSDNVYYVIRTNSSKATFEQILKNMQYIEE